jgi:outer membrane protein
MKKMLKSFGLVFVLACAAFGAQAEDFRVGVINTDRVFKESNAAKQAQSKLEQDFSKRQKDLDDAGKTLKAAIDKFDVDAPTLAESQRIARQKQLGEQDREFQRKRRDLQDELNARKSEELQAVLAVLNRVIKQIAENEKYDLILQEAVYFNPKHDITDKVLKVMNAAK